MSNEKAELTIITKCRDVCLENPFTTADIDVITTNEDPIVNLFLLEACTDEIMSKIILPSVKPELRYDFVIDFTERLRSYLSSLCSEDVKADRYNPEGDLLREKNPFELSFFD